MTTSTRPHIKELAHRAADGVEVALLWNSRSNALLVVVDDARSSDRFAIDVAKADALDAFHHPYAYAAAAGVEYAAAKREVVYA